MTVFKGKHQYSDSGLSNIIIGAWPASICAKGTNGLGILLSVSHHTI